MMMRGGSGKFWWLALAAALLVALITGLAWLVWNAGLLAGKPAPSTPCEHPRHLVSEGEPLIAIARRYGVTVNEIARQNSLNGSALVLGQVLEIPICAENSAVTATPTPAAAPGGKEASYVVDAGDTCSSIAFLYGVSEQSIIKANQLNSACSDLWVGQVLRIPQAAAEAAGRISLSAAGRMVREWVFANQPDMNPAATFPVIEITPPGAWEQMKVQVFKVTGETLSMQSFAAAGGQIYPVGESFGGAGINAMLVADLEGDGAPELLYAYGFGSGIHQSSIGMLRRAADGVYSASPVEGLRYLGNLSLEQDAQQGVLVRGDAGGAGGAGEWQVLGRLQVEKGVLVIAPGD